MKKFSVILPVKNGGEYVKSCVQSILSQSLNSFELLVLDSGSNDGTPGWISSLQDKRIKILPAERSLSIEENWARIVALDKNEFITLIGHDDILEPDFLKQMDELITHFPDASLYTSQFNYIDSSGSPLRDAKPIERVEDGPVFLQALLQNRADIMGTGYVMRSADYNKIGGIPAYPNLLFADFELWLNLARISYKVASAEKLFSFRIHQSTTTISPDTKFQAAFGKLISFLGSLKQEANYDQVLQKYAVNFIRHYCKALSHRLLRTPKAKRGGLSVKVFIEQCKSYADILVPGNKYEPEADLSVRAGKWFDSNEFGRGMFLFFKRLYNKPVLK